MKKHIYHSRKTTEELIQIFKKVDQLKEAHQQALINARVDAEVR